MKISINPDAFDCYLDTLSDPLQKVFFSIMFQFCFDSYLEISAEGICDMTNLPLSQVLSCLHELEKNQCFTISGEKPEVMPWPMDGSK